MNYLYPMVNNLSGIKLFYEEDNLIYDGVYELRIRTCRHNAYLRSLKQIMAAYLGNGDIKAVFNLGHDTL